jgi:hypothetical protein
MRHPLIRKSGLSSPTIRVGMSDASASTRVLMQPIKDFDPSQPGTMTA